MSIKKHIPHEKSFHQYNFINVSSRSTKITCLKEKKEVEMDSYYNVGIARISGYLMVGRNLPVMFGWSQIYDYRVQIDVLYFYMFV